MDQIVIGPRCDNKIASGIYISERLGKASVNFWAGGIFDLNGSNGLSAFDQYQAALSSFVGSVEIAFPNHVYRSLLI